jgi:hypothetical protein
MWKICQEARLQTEVMTAHPAALPDRNHRRNLARFIVRLGILKIEGKNKKAATRRSPSARLSLPFARGRFSLAFRSPLAAFRSGQVYAGLPLASRCLSLRAGLRWPSARLSLPFARGRFSLAFRSPLAAFRSGQVFARLPLASRCLSLGGRFTGLSLVLCSVFVPINASLVLISDAFMLTNASFVRTNASLVLVSQLTCPESSGSFVYTSDAFMSTNDVTHAHIVT